MARLRAHPQLGPLLSGGLKGLAVRGTAWTVVGTFGAQGMRLVSNLILTRLLFPEAFGLMALVQAVITGLSQFADVGIAPSIIHSKRGDDPQFLDAAWTIQVIRGAGLWLATCALAYPASKLLDQPLLLQFLPVSGLSLLILGMMPTKLLSARRHLALRKLTVVEISSQLVGLICLVALAWWWRSVWALVVGTVVSSLVHIAVASLWIPGRMNRVSWDKDARAELINFGRWILVGTAATYLSGQGIRLVQGSLVPVATLGILSIAGNLAWAAGSLAAQVENRVLFPVYGKLREKSSHEFGKRVLRARRAVLLAVLPVFCGLMFLGNIIIDFLYDDRYQRAGVFLGIIALNSAIAVVGMQYGSVLLAKGDARSHTLVQSVQAVLRVGGSYLGFALAGEIGMVLAIGIATVLSYPLQARAVSRHACWQPRLDAAAYAGITTCAVLAYLVYRHTL